MIFPFVLIGHCDYFGFGFTTLNRKALYSSGFAFGVDTILNFVLFTKSHNNWLNNKRGLRIDSYATRMYPHVTCMYPYVIRMLLVCYWYVSVCIVCYSYVTRMLLVVLLWSFGQDRTCPNRSINKTYAAVKIYFTL